MILEALISEFEQRFRYEKRANVCLWFDERDDFRRILSDLEAALIQNGSMTLLRYDPSKGHGQIWLRSQIHRALLADPETRFVIYLPVAEDQLDGPKGKLPPLALLTSLLHRSQTWRIGGKRPTLFTFLRHIGVSMPEPQSEQQQLYDGGGDSVLARYVAAHVRQPESFWKAHALSLKRAQADLVGDVAAVLFRLAEAPERRWSELEEKGVLPDFLARIAELYGYRGEEAAPVEWIAEFVTMIALTETFVGYHEPRDFPFADRLPEPIHRQACLELLRRWLQDVEARAVWDYVIWQIEKGLNLTSWAAGRTGRSYGFPHLVTARWKEMLDALGDVSTRKDEWGAFLRQRADDIREEARYARASHGQVPDWSVLEQLVGLHEAVDRYRDEVGRIASLDAAAELFVRGAGAVDQAHLRLRAAAEAAEAAVAAKLGDWIYADHTNRLNHRFAECLDDVGDIAFSSVPGVTEELGASVWGAEKPRAVVIVDALRYDCALWLQELLTGLEVDVAPVRAMVPSVTPAGMTAMLPIGGRSVTLRTDGGRLRPFVDEVDLGVRANRLKFLEAEGAECLDINALEAASAAPDPTPKLLVVFGHEEVDSLGHGDATALVRHAELEVQRLARLVRKLHGWGYSEVHVVTDHGFILLPEEYLPEEVPCKPEWCVLRKERYAVVSAEADVDLMTLPMPWDPSVKVAVPPGLAFFKAEKSFSHGGAALQEIVIPHLTSRRSPPEATVFDVEVVPQEFTLMLQRVKVLLRPKRKGAGDLLPFEDIQRSLRLDVRRPGEERSLLHRGPVVVTLSVHDQEKAETLFFEDNRPFKQDDLVVLWVEDAETKEQLVPGGVKLTIGRDL